MVEKERIIAPPPRGRGSAARLRYPAHRRFKQSPCSVLDGSDPSAHKRQTFILLYPHTPARDHRLLDVRWPGENCRGITPVSTPAALRTRPKSYNGLGLWPRGKDLEWIQGKLNGFSKGMRGDLRAQCSVCARFMKGLREGYAPLAARMLVSIP